MTFPLYHDKTIKKAIHRTFAVSDTHHKRKKTKAVSFLLMLFEKTSA